MRKCCFVASLVFFGSIFHVSSIRIAHAERPADDRAYAVPFFGSTSSEAGPEVPLSARSGSEDAGVPSSDSNSLQNTIAAEADAMLLPSCDVLPIDEQTFGIPTSWDPDAENLKNESNVSRLVILLGDESFDLREDAETRLKRIFTELQAEEQLGTGERFGNSIAVHDFLSWVRRYLLPPAPDLEIRARAARIIRDENVRPGFDNLIRESNRKNAVAIASALLRPRIERRIEAYLLSHRSDFLLRGMQRQFGMGAQIHTLYDDSYANFGFTRTGEAPYLPDDDTTRLCASAFRMEAITDRMLGGIRLAHVASGAEYFLFRTYSPAPPFVRFSIELRSADPRMTLRPSDIYPFHLRTLFVLKNEMKDEALLDTPFRVPMVVGTADSAPGERYRSTALQQDLKYSFRITHLGYVGFGTLESFLLGQLETYRQYRPVE